MKDCDLCGGDERHGHYPGCPLIPSVPLGATVIVLSGPGMRQLTDEVSRMCRAHGSVTFCIAEPITYDPSDGSAKGVRG